MSGYMRAPLDQVRIDLLVGLLRRGARFSTGDRGRRQLSFNGQVFTTSLTDRASAEAQAAGMDEAALRRFLATEPRHLYDAFLVDGLVREAHAALERGDGTLAQAPLTAALSLDYKRWAPQVGLALVLAADHAESARKHLNQALAGFAPALYHYALIIGVDPRQQPEAYVALLTRVIAIEGRCVSAFTERAEALSALGRDRDAAKDHARAAALASEVPL